MLLCAIPDASQRICVSWPIVPCSRKRVEQLFADAAAMPSLESVNTASPSRSAVSTEDITSAVLLSAQRDANSLSALSKYYSSGADALSTVVSTCAKISKEFSVNAATPGTLFISGGWRIIL